MKNVLGLQNIVRARKMSPRCIPIRCKWRAVHTFGFPGTNRGYRLHLNLLCKAFVALNFNIIWHRDLLTRLYSYYKQVAKKGFLPITYVFGNTIAILLWMQAAQFCKKHILKQVIAFLGHHLSGEWFLFIELCLLYCMWKERTTENYRGVQSGG